MGVFNMNGLMFGVELGLAVSFRGVVIGCVKGKRVMASGVTAGVIVFLVEYFWGGNEVIVVVRGVLGGLGGVYGVEVGLG